MRVRLTPSRHFVHADLQSADVTRPILVVSKLCHGGAQVICDRISGEVHVPDGMSILFERRGGQ